MPYPVVVELIHVADKVIGGLPIEQNRRSRMPFEFNISEWAGDLSPNFCKLTSTSLVFPAVISTF